MSPLSLTLLQLVNNSHSRLALNSTDIKLFFFLEKKKMFPRKKRKGVIKIIEESSSKLDQ